MTSSKPKAGADRSAVAERTEEAFETAVRLRMHEIGMSERKARFVTAIEFGVLPDGDVVMESANEEDALIDSVKRAMS